MDETPIEEVFTRDVSRDSSDRNLIRDILDPSDIIEEIEMNLRGYRLNPDRDPLWIKEKNQKAIKESGIKLITQTLREHLPKNQTLATLTDNQIIRLARDIWIMMVGLIYENWENFMYEDDNSNDPPLAIFDKIICLIDHNIFCNLTRAKNGQENILIRTVYKSHDVVGERTREYEQMGNKGWSLGNMFRRKKTNPRDMDIADRPLYND